MRVEAQERASFDYIQAGLIIKGIGIILGSKEKYPTLNEVYPNMFEDVAKAQEDKIQQKKMELSALRFKQFAHSFNSRRC